MPHASIPASERERIGITPDLVGVSVGIEDVEDLIADLEEALALKGYEDVDSVPLEQPVATFIA